MEDLRKSFTFVAKADALITHRTGIGFMFSEIMLVAGDVDIDLGTEYVITLTPTNKGVVNEEKAYIGSEEYELVYACSAPEQLFLPDYDSIPDVLKDMINELDGFGCEGGGNTGPLCYEGFGKPCPWAGRLKVYDR